MTSSPPRCSDARVQRLIELFEHLGPQDLARLGDFYAIDARFRDPFQDVRGLDAVQRAFRHMFEALHAPRFVVHDVLAADGRCFLGWDLLLGLRGGQREHCIPGSSVLRFDAEGRVREHVDHWDAAALYEKLPGLGAPMRWLRRRMVR